MALTTHRPATTRGQVPISQLRRTIAKTTDAQLRTLRIMAADNFTRTAHIHQAIEDEIERRHWPGSITCTRQETTAA
jgi:hypothetical protein